MVSTAWRAAVEGVASASKQQAIEAAAIQQQQQQQVAHSPTVEQQHGQAVGQPQAYTALKHCMQARRQSTHYRDGLMARMGRRQQLAQGLIPVW